MNNFPPGTTGKIAQFIHDQSNTRVPEIAIAGAIGCMSGIVGRAYNVSGTGLNQYTILLAPTGSGKGAMRIGIGKLFAAVRTKCPESAYFVGPGNISKVSSFREYFDSGKLSFCSICGEFSDYMHSMATRNPSNSFFELNHFLRAIYEMSAHGLSMEPSLSNGRNTDMMSPSVSLLGESTPEAFYTALTNEMILNGLLSRFTVIEYEGEIPLLSTDIQELPAYLALDFEKLCANAAALNSKNQCISVEIDQRAQKQLESLAKMQNEIINDTKREVVRHLWNRVHLKAMKLAGLVAVGVDSVNPLITGDMVDWASTIIIASTKRIESKLSTTRAKATDESRTLLKLMNFLLKFTKSDYEKIKKAFRGPLDMFKDRVITKGFISQRLSSNRCFHVNGGFSKELLEQAINVMQKKGILTEVKKSEVYEKYGYKGRCFLVRVENINKEILESKREKRDSAVTSQIGKRIPV